MRIVTLVTTNQSHVMKKLLALSLLCVFLGSCASQHSASNLSFVDVSLNYDSEDFDIVELKPVKRSASSFVGISANDESSAQLDRSTYAVGNATSLGSATFIGGAFPIMITAFTYAENTDGRSIIFGLVSTALWGVYNDVVWSNTVKNKAIERCNYSLVERYPDIDAFINPKYEISWSKGFATTTCRVTLTAQGVVLKNKLQYNQTNSEELEIVEEDRIVSSVYEKSVGNLNYLASLIKMIAPTASDVPGLSQKDLKDFKRIIKRYESNYLHVKDFEDYQAVDLLLSEEQFEAFWNEYMKLK
jgi:hypothetical protein